MRVVTCIFVEHNLWLVGLAAVTCLAGSTVTLQLWRRAIEATGRTWLDWCFLTAVTARASIWATHFVAMLGHRPGVPVTLDPALTIASVLVAIAGAGAGVGLPTSAWPTMGLCGGGLVGLAVVAMHYMGRFAYRVEGIASGAQGSLRCQSWWPFPASLPPRTLRDAGPMVQGVTPRPVRWSEASCPFTSLAWGPSRSRPFPAYPRVATPEPLSPWRLALPSWRWSSSVPVCRVT